MAWPRLDIRVRYYGEATLLSVCLFTLALPVLVLSQCLLSLPQVAHSQQHKSFFKLAWTTILHDRSNTNLFGANVNGFRSRQL